MLGGWVNPHREQQTTPQGQTSSPPKSCFTPTAKAPSRPGAARDVGRRAGSHTPSTGIDEKRPKEKFVLACSLPGLGESTAAEAVNDIQSMSQGTGTQSGPQGPHKAAYTEGRGTHTGNTQTRLHIEKSLSNCSQRSSLPPSHLRRFVLAVAHTFTDGL